MPTPPRAPPWSSKAICHHPQKSSRRSHKIAGSKPEDLTIIFAPTQSLAGGTQIVARALEVALHKTHELGFPLERIVDGMGTAPLCPPHPDFVTAYGPDQ